MKTKLDYYRIFNEAARTLSFSIASQNLYVSQSAISQVIKTLENDLHVKLFVRTSKGVELTKEGMLLYEASQSALNLLNQAETQLEGIKALKGGTLTIGAGDTITSNLLLPHLEKFHALYPQVNLLLVNRTSLDMIELIRQEKVDLAFLNLPIDCEGIATRNCFEVHDVFVGDDRYKNDTHLYTREEIANLPMILLEKNSNSRKIVEKQFNESGIKLNPQIEIGAHELLLQLANIHLGIACVIKEFSLNAIKNQQVYELKMAEPLKPRYIGCAYRQGNLLSNAAQTFLDFILESEIK